MAYDQVSVLHLRYFLAVLDEGTVRAAAGRIGISQPSLSQQLLRLEQRLGVRLFERSPAGMRPTERGEQLGQIAERMTRELEELSEVAGVIRRIGVPRGTDAEVLGMLTDRFGDAVEIVALDSGRALHAIGREVDAALLRGPVLSLKPGVELSEVRVAPLGVLHGSGHELAGRGLINWEDLDGQTLLWFDDRRAPDFAQWLLECCRTHGWTPQTRRLDPAGAQIFEDALRRSRDTVALTPCPRVLPWGLAWIPLSDPPLERLFLAVRSAMLRLG
ncbi:MULTISPECIES: LysR family transcriptional regulator [unclassified Microbacterium]|uniref:LysR family transcriptional regulator n=1 Tax=unclassified Microbacterium TaxID=2609290 RepID=UPI0015E47206|nr:MULTISPECIES: LysR family transcriptional regulator [unclassified Microbacterium]